MARILNAFFLAALLMVQPCVTYSDENSDASGNSEAESQCEKLATDEDLEKGEREDYLAVCRQNIRICAAAAAREGIDEMDYTQYLKECIYNAYIERSGDPEEDLEDFHGTR